MGYCVPMILKLLTPIAFLAAQFLITWYGHFMGKAPAKGILLGMQYDSAIISLLIVQLKFLWVPILINVLFGMGFQWGNETYRNFLIVISLWIAMGPIAAMLFNTAVVKESIDWPIILGLILVTCGAVCIVAHKDIAALLN